SRGLQDIQASQIVKGQAEDICKPGSEGLDLPAWRYGENGGAARHDGKGVEVADIEKPVMRRKRRRNDMSFNGGNIGYATYRAIRSNLIQFAMIRFDRIEIASEIDHIPPGPIWLEIAGIRVFHRVFHDKLT